jgi:hypothetical protein
MPRTLPISLLLLCSAATAHAERDTSLSVTGGFALVSELDAASTAEPEAGPLLGATLAWDHAPPEYPAVPGYAWAGDLVPDVTLARAGDEAILMTGVRLELDYAQREQGLFRISARGSMWIAPRLAIVLETSQLLAGGELGTSYQLGRSGWSFGYFVGVLGWPGERAEPPPDSLALVPELEDRPEPEPALTVLGGLTLSRAY